MFKDRWNLLLLLVFLLLVPGLFWGLPSAYSVQVDSPLPLGSLLFFVEYNKPQLNITYPAFHQILMLPFYAAAFGFYWLVGGFSRLSSSWPYGLRDATTLFSVLFFITNLVSAVMGVLMLRTMKPYVEREERWVWFPMLMMGTNSLFIYYSRVGNLDMAYNFWWGVALFFLWRYLMEGGGVKESLIPAGIAAACAAGSKDQAVGMIIGAGLLLLLYGPGEKQRPFAERFRQTVIFGLAVVVGYAVVAIAPQPMRWWNHAQFVVSPHSPTHIPLTLAGEVEVFLLNARLLWNVYTGPILLLALAGAVVLLRSGRSRLFWLLALPALSYYIVIIAKTRVVLPRFMLPFLIPVMVLATHGLAWLGSRVETRAGGKKLLVGALGCILLYHAAVRYAPVTYAQIFDQKRELARDLPGIVEKGSGLLLSSMQTYEYPNVDVYNNYTLMKLPLEPVIPASRHSSSIFKPLDPTVEYYLLGGGTSGLPENTPLPPMPLEGELVKEWKFPAWVRDGILVPCIFEYRLYRRSGPLPLDYQPPAVKTTGLQ